jgi:hypothetical protein
MDDERETVTRSSDSVKNFGVDKEDDESDLHAPEDAESGEALETDPVTAIDENECNDQGDTATERTEEPGAALLEDSTEPLLKVSEAQKVVATGMSGAPLIEHASSLSDRGIGKSNPDDEEEVEASEIARTPAIAQDTVEGLTANHATETVDSDSDDKEPATSELAEALKWGQASTPEDLTTNRALSGISAEGPELEPTESDSTTITESAVEGRAVTDPKGRICPFLVPSPLQKIPPIQTLFGPSVAFEVSGIDKANGNLSPLQRPPPIETFLGFTAGSKDSDNNEANTGLSPPRNIPLIETFLGFTDTKRVNKANESLGADSESSARIPEVTIIG